MAGERTWLWNLYAGAVAAAAALVTTKAVEAAWRSTTGDEPPHVVDPHTPLRRAVTWTLASTVAIGLVNVLANRLAAKTWEAALGRPAPGADRNPQH